VRCWESLVASFLSSANISTRWYRQLGEKKKKKNYVDQTGFPFRDLLNASQPLPVVRHDGEGGREGKKKDGIHPQHDSNPI